MQKLFERTDIEGMEHHAKNPVRVYTEDLQHDRIRRSVAMAQKVLATFPPGQMKFVYELGCGTGDICGQLKGDYVTGWDCNEACILHARERWKWEGANFYVGNIEKIGPFPVHGTGDLLILCETLEHLSDPLAFVRKWLPHFETVLISHPIDGDIHGDHSGGDHQWSYTDRKSVV